MIDPDLIDISIIPDSKITMIEIENVSKIKKQNSFLKSSVIVIAFIVIAIVIDIYHNRKKDNPKKL